MLNIISKLFCLVPLFLISLSSFAADCSDSGLLKLRREISAQSFVTAMNLSQVQGAINQVQKKKQPKTKLILDSSFRPGEGTYTRTGNGMTLKIASAKALQSFFASGLGKESAPILEDLQRFKFSHEALNNWDKKNKVAQAQTSIILADAHRALYQQEMTELDSLLQAIDKQCSQSKPGVSSGQMKLLPSHEAGADLLSQPASPPGQAGSAKDPRTMDPRDVYQPYKPQMTQ